MGVGIAVATSIKESKGVGLPGMERDIMYSLPGMIRCGVLFLFNSEPGTSLAPDPHRVGRARLTWHKAALYSKS